MKYKMKRKGWMIAMSLVVSSVAATAQVPRWCQNARSNVEVEICTQPDLISMENTMTRLYRRALNLVASPKEREDLRRGQRGDGSVIATASALTEACSVCDISTGNASPS